MTSQAARRAAFDAFNAKDAKLREGKTGKMYSVFAPVTRLILLGGEMKSARHCLLTKKERVVLQIFAIGPNGMSYVDPADDPRKG